MIRFPRLHIAESVLNRIQNTMEGTGALGVQIPPPIVPDPTMQGAVLDEQLAAPLPSAGVTPEEQPIVEDEMATASALGGSPFEGMLGSGSF